MEHKIYDPTEERNCKVFEATHFEILSLSLSLSDPVKPNDKPGRVLWELIGPRESLPLRRGKSKGTFS